MKVTPRICDKHNECLSVGCGKKFETTPLDRVEFLNIKQENAKVQRPLCKHGVTSVQKHWVKCVLKKETLPERECRDCTFYEEPEQIVGTVHRYSRL